MRGSERPEGVHLAAPRLPTQPPPAPRLLSVAAEAIRPASPGSHSPKPEIRVGWVRRCPREEVVACALNESAPRDLSNTEKNTSSRREILFEKKLLKCLAVAQVPVDPSTSATTSVDVCEGEPASLQTPGWATRWSPAKSMTGCPGPTSRHSEEDKMRRGPLRRPTRWRWSSDTSNAKLPNR